MGRPCSICAHPERESIDRALLEATGLSLIAKRFRITASSLLRHRDSHLVRVGSSTASKAESDPSETLPAPPASLSQTSSAPSAPVEAKSESRSALDLMQQLRAINGACLEVLRQARGSGQPMILLRAVDRIAKQIDLQSKLLGDMTDGVRVNPAASPEWHAIRSAVFAALEVFPDARRAVADALQGLK